MDDELELELLDELDELLELELFDEFEERLELELSEELDERLLLEFDQPLRSLEFLPPETTDLKNFETSLSAIAGVCMAGAATSIAPSTARIFFICHLLFDNLGDCLGGTGDVLVYSIDGRKIGRQGQRRAASLMQPRDVGCDSNRGAIAMRNRIASWLSAFILVPILLTNAALGATLDIQTSAEPATLDPQKLTGDWPDLIVGDLFEGLVTEDASGTPVAGQAESWKVSSDGLTYTFKLRDGLKWSDGEALEASDFLLGLRRVLDPKTKADFAFIQFPIKNAEAFNSGQVTDPAALGVAAPDAKTLEIKLERPMPYFLQALVQASAYPVPQHIIEKFGNDWAKPEHLVSNGAFKLAEWKPGKTLRAVKNDRYREAGEVQLDEVVYHFIDDEGATLAAYKAGNIDIATQFPAAQMDELQSSRPGEARIVPAPGIWYYVLNLKTPPFNDPRVRRALSMVIDREQIGTVLETGQLAAYGMVPLGVPGFGDTPYMPDWSAKTHEQRVTEATTLMQSAGYGPGKPLKFQLRTSNLPLQIKTSEAVAKAWKEIGAEVEFVREEIPEHQDALKKGDFTAGSARWILDYADANDSLALMKTGHPNNYAGYSNPGFDILLNKAATEQDAAERVLLLRVAEEMALDETAVIPLTWAVSKNLVSPKVVGFEDNVRDVHRSRWLSLKE